MPSTQNRPTHEDVLLIIEVAERVVEQIAIPFYAGSGSNIVGSVYLEVAVHTGENVVDG
jgi:hypothetical protein